MKLTLSILLSLFICVSAIADSGQILIGYDKETPVGFAAMQIETSGYEVVDHLPFFNIYLVKPNPEKVSIATIAQLKTMPGVEAVDLNIERQWIDAIPQPSVKIKSSEIPWGVAKVNAPDAWSTNRGSRIKVAVVDTGIDKDHPDLVANLRGGYNALDQSENYDDDHSHGTHVAGSIGAVLNQAQVVGVAPSVELYGVKVLTKDGGGNLFSIIRGMQWVAQNGMQIANMSLGAPQDNMIFKYAVDQAANAGVIVVAAAGNDGKAVNWPAAYPNTIAVSALCPDFPVNNAKLCTDGGKKLANFSSRGPEVEFIAPGVQIPSTVINGDVKAYSGTSMAAPHLAGLAALAMAKGATGIDGVRDALKRASVQLPGLSASEQGAGLPSAKKLR